MTKENANLFLPLVQALADGKILETRGPNSSSWTEIEKHVFFSEAPECYRIKPEPRLVPLGPEDVPPGSVFRHKAAVDQVWAAPTSVEVHDLQLGGKAYSYIFLQREFLIKRPGEDWKPCHKEA
jgi:hypothetical protein